MALFLKLLGRVIFEVTLCVTNPPFFFVDDSLLFCKANQQDYRKILDILETYRKCLGQQINTSKTTIFFSQVTLEDSRQFIKEALRVLENRQYEKYLSLPSLTGRKKKKKASFDYIKERVWQKLQDWEKKLLSQVAREVFIKAVV